MKSVLIVEDDPLTSDVLRTGLAERGYSVAVVENGKEALEHLREREADVILLDLMMPVMDGFSFLMEFKKTAAASRTRVVIVSARSMGELFGPGSRFGDYRFVEKPFQIDELAKIIQQVSEDKI